MASLGFQSQSQRRFMQARRPDVAAAWDRGRTLGGRSFQPRALTTLPVRKSGVRRQGQKRRRGRI